MKQTFLPNERAVAITGPFDAGQNNVINLILNKFKFDDIEQIEDLSERTCANESKILIIKTNDRDAHILAQMAQKDGAKVIPVFIWATKKERTDRIKSENPNLDEKTITVLLEQGTSRDTPRDLPDGFIEIRNPSKETDEATACAIEKEIRKTLMSTSRKKKFASVNLKSRKHTSSCSM